MDRAFAEPLDVPAVAAVAHLSEAHFIRSFRAVFGETPHRYLQRRRVERSMFLLRETDRSVTDICFDVGFTRRRTTAGGIGRWWRPTASRWRPRGRGGGAGGAGGDAIEQFWRRLCGDGSL